MSISKIIFAAATCSWIDPTTGLPEVDKVRVTTSTTTRSFLTGNSGYRFCNFLEVSVDADTSKRLIVTRAFTRSSVMYRGPSYLNIPSHAFDIKQDIYDEPDAVRFTQVTGARTVSPEVLGTGGGLVGGIILGGVIGSAVPVVGTALGAIAGGAIGIFTGEIGLRQFVAFPPIWSKVQIRVYKDGRTEAQLLQHSIFPSLTFFRQVGGNFERADASSGSAFYDATKEKQLPDWQSHGWGSLDSKSTSGPCSGNPWGLRKGVTGGGDNVPTSVR